MEVTPPQESATALAARIAEQANLQETPPTLSLPASRSLASQLGLSPLDVELAALKAHILPERYRRNLGTVGWDGQIRLLTAHVAVVGAGGLGGWVIEGLARMGVGHLAIIDGDRFTADNLNRQLGCTEAQLGRLKAECLAERVAAINSAVQATAQATWLDADNAPALLAGAQVVVDALDSIPARLILQSIAGRLGIPMVHGAIAGFTGQVTTILPGDAGLRALYPDAVPQHGVERVLGNPAATPMMVAAWQIHEVVKFLTGQGELLRGRLLLMDAEYGEVNQVLLDGHADEETP